MQFKQIGLATLMLIGINQMSFANAVHLHVNQQTKIGYYLGHKNAGEETHLSSLKTLTLNDTTTIPISLDGYQYAGIVPAFINDKPLPSEATQFAVRNQCTMATDKNHAEGTLAFKYKSSKTKKASITCIGTGGIFG